MATAIQTGVFTLKSSHPSAMDSGERGTFTDVPFPVAFPEGSRVAVVPFVQTFNGPDTPGLRIAEVTPTGFKIRMNELVANGGKDALSNGVHCAETVAYVAFIVDSK